MTFVIFQFLISALIIVIAGVFLTKFADKIADSTGWGKMFVGSLFLAGATSLPELMVDLKSVQMNLPDLAVGDLLGSSLINLLILATLDFSYPSAFRRTTFSPVFLHHSLSAVLTIILTAIVAMGIASRIETSFLGVSIFSWAIVIVYFFGLRLIFTKSISGSITTSYTKEQNINQAKYRTILFALLGYSACALVIFIVAPYIVRSANDFAMMTGLGHTFIGTTLVALSTSLPELVSTLAAFRLGVPDLAIGNIFGSNAFNMILFFPLDFMYEKPIFSSVSHFHIVTALAAITATAVAVMGQLYRIKERSRFFEPSSEAVVVLVGLFLFLLYQMKSV